MNNVDIDVYESSESKICVIENVIATPWKFIAVAEIEYYDGDINIVIYGYGNTEEEARTDIDKKLFIYAPILEDLE